MSFFVYPAGKVHTNSKICCMNFPISYESFLHGIFVEILVRSDASFNLNHVTDIVLYSIFYGLKCTVLGKVVGFIIFRINSALYDSICKIGSYYRCQLPFKAHELHRICAQNLFQMYTHVNSPRRTLQYVCLYLVHMMFIFFYVNSLYFTRLYLSLKM